MADHESYKVAIDILRCHLGMTTDEACNELGIVQESNDFNVNAELLTRLLDKK